MEQNPSYIRISELIKMTRHDPAHHEGRCEQALDLIEQTFRLIDEMAIEEREEVMKRLTGWMLVEKFETKGLSALTGLQRYCIAQCLYEDPDWSPPKEVIARKLLPSTY